MQELERSHGQSRLRFEVEDSGIGMAADKLSLLFSPFQQLDGSMSRRFEGTGLGLAISRNLAERMAGTVSVSSHPGQGSVFSLDLTLRISDKSRAQCLPSMDFHGRRTLVVDDNTHARNQLVELLHALSCQTDEAHSGLMAIERIAQADATDQPYDVVFLDWKMPELNGLETAAHIRRLSLRQPCPHVVLIASSGQEFPDAQDRRQIDAVLAKPVTPSELLDTVIGLFKPVPAQRDEVATVLESGECLAGRSILLVEDNQINQEVVQGLLEMVGASVTIASDGLQGIQMLHQQRFDLVLMDIHMPKMDGFDATAAIRKNPAFASLPIVALTANALEGDIERCLAAGMNDYLAKPIQPQHMFTTLKRHLPPTSAHASDSKTSGAAIRISKQDPPLTAEHDAILAELMRIPALNVEQAVARMLGRHDLYIQLAKRIATERGDMVEKLHAALDAKDSNTLLELIHTAKSILGTLGADALQQHGIELQKGLLDGANVEREIAAFTADLAALLQHLQAAILRD